MAGGHPCQGIYTTPKGTKPKVAFIATHYNVDFAEHYIAPYVATRGFGFLGWNTRYRGTEDQFLKTLKTRAEHERNDAADVEGFPRLTTVPRCGVGGMDKTPLVETFALLLEKVCIDVVESGRMTKDLATLIRPDHAFLSTDEFLDAVDAELKRRMS